MAHYDPARELGYVRLLISDTANTDADRVFSDDEINAVLGREGNAKLAASVLLLIIAANEALVAKAIRTQDLQTDGPKVAAEMRALAGVYRSQGVAEKTVADEDDTPVIVNYTDRHHHLPELAQPPLGWPFSVRGV